MARKGERRESEKTGAGAPRGATRTSRRTQLAVAAVVILVATFALGGLVFLGAPGRTGAVQASPRPTPGASVPPSPPPGFASAPGTRPGGSPRPGDPSRPFVLASPAVAPSPSALEGRFPRTLEGTAALFAAMASERSGPARVELLREYARRVGAGLADDLRAPVPVPVAEVEAFFQRALDDADASVRLEALGILSNREFAPAGPILEAFLARGGERDARRVAMGALAQVEGERALSLLADLAGRDAAPDRIAALEALANVGGPAAVDALEKVASGADTPDTVRDRAKSLARRARFVGQGPPR